MARFDTALELMEHAFSTYGDQPAYESMGCELSFADIDRLSYRFASYLQNELKLQAGDRLAIQMPNVLAFPIAFYGAVRAGIVVVNTNPLYTPRELLHQLKDSGAKALVVLSNIAHTAAEVVEQTDVEQVIVANIADLHPSPKRQLIHFVVKYVKKLVPAFHFKRCISFRDALKLGQGSVSTPQVDKDTVLMLQYTGGTTGVSKGAMLSHGNLCSNVWQLREHTPEPFTPAHIHLACLPLYHIYALNLHALNGFSSGAKLVLIANPRDLQSVVDGFRKHSITVFVGINTLFNALLHFEPFKKLNFASLQVTCAGGMALTPEAAKQWHQLTGCEIVEGYGLTETSPVVSSNLCCAPRLGTIGLPVPETEIKILDDNNNELPMGEAGELCVKGPQIMLGYWQNQEETDKVLSPDGWLRTGDMAMVMDDGYLKIVDRKKDIIIVSGFNVYPNEIEAVVCQMDGIVEAAAIGVNNDKSGESIKLFVVRDDPSVSEEAIIAHCRKNLTAYKIPRQIVFCEDLPKSNVGKILRRELRA